MKSKIKIAYACGIDFQHHLKETNMELYASVADLKRDRQCWSSCGIVEVQLKIKKWVVKQDLPGFK